MSLENEIKKPTIAIKDLTEATLSNKVEYHIDLDKNAELLAKIEEISPEKEEESQKDVQESVEEPHKDVEETPERVEVIEEVLGDEAITLDELIAEARRNISLFTNDDFIRSTLSAYNYDKFSDIEEDHYSEIYNMIVAKNNE